MTRTVVGRGSGISERRGWRVGNGVVIAIEAHVRRLASSDRRHNSVPKGCRGQRPRRLLGENLGRIVQSQSTGDALKRREGLDVAAQKTLDRAVRAAVRGIAPVSQRQNSV